MDMPTRADTAMPALPLRRDGERSPNLYLVGERKGGAERPVVLRARKLVSINGRWHSLGGPVATFEQIIAIAYPITTSQTMLSPTVTWRRGTAEKPRGSLTARGSVPIADGMLISAQATILS